MSEARTAAGQRAERSAQLRAAKAARAFIADASKLSEVSGDDVRECCLDSRSSLRSTVVSAHGCFNAALTCRNEATDILPVSERPQPSSCPM